MQLAEGKSGLIDSEAKSIIRFKSKSLGEVNQDQEGQKTWIQIADRTVLCTCVMRQMSS